MATLWKLENSAQLGHPVRHGELILHDDAQRIRKSRHEGDHCKEQEHHDDGQGVIFLLFHKIYQCLG